jgi:hypothetical protein
MGLNVIPALKGRDFLAQEVDVPTRELEPWFQRSHWISANLLSLRAQVWRYRHRNAQWFFVPVAA